VLFFPVFAKLQPRRIRYTFPSLNFISDPLARISFPCHTSENSPVSPAIATDPKTPSRKSFPCHTSDTPRVAILGRSNLSSPQRNQPMFQNASILILTFRIGPIDATLTKNTGVGVFFRLWNSALSPIRQTPAIRRFHRTRITIQGSHVTGHGPLPLPVPPFASHRRSARIRMETP